MCIRDRYTNDVRTRQRLSGSKNVHPGFGVMIVPHGTPNGKSVHKDHEKYYGKVDEATKLEKKTRQVQNRTAAAYAQQKTEHESGEKTAKYNRLAKQLDKLRNRG